LVGSGAEVAEHLVTDLWFNPVLYPDIFAGPTSPGEAIEIALDCPELIPQPEREKNWNKVPQIISALNGIARVGVEL